MAAFLGVFVCNFGYETHSVLMMRFRCDGIEETTTREVVVRLQFMAGDDVRPLGRSRVYIG